MNKVTTDYRESLIKDISLKIKHGITQVSEYYLRLLIEHEIKKEYDWFLYMDINLGTREGGFRDDWIWNNVNVEKLIDDVILRIQ